MQRNWRTELTKNEAWWLERLERQIAVQTAAVRALPDNPDLVATLCLLKHRRYQIQSRAGARLKRWKQGSKPRWALAAARNTTKSAKIPVRA
jgi:hypothetical protein